jgi:hypothetical protein
VSAWLAAAYAVLALGLAWSLAGGTRWLVRVPFIVVAPAVALGLWLDRPNPAGWPRAAAPPARTSLVSAVVREPDPSTGDAGAIYLWLDVGGNAPRAFALPYSRRNHEQVAHALARLAHRQPVALVGAPAGGATHGRTLRFAVERPQLPQKTR